MLKCINALTSHLKWKLLYVTFCCVNEQIWNIVPSVAISSYNPQLIMPITYPHTHTVAHLERKHLLSEHARQQDTHDVRSEQRGVIQSYPIRYNLVHTANCFEELVRLLSGVCVCVFWCVG